MALVTQFLSGIRGFVLGHDGAKLRDWLTVEAGSAMYVQLGDEVRNGFGDEGLLGVVDKCLPEEDDVGDGRGSPWPGLNSFIKDYLEYWRDVHFDDLAGVYRRLSGLLNSCANAFANPTYGMMLLQTSLYMSESLSSIITTISRQPDTLAAVQVDTGSAEEGTEKKSIVEEAADLMQKMFTSCLTDRSSTRWSAPKGKKTAVYRFANIVLKLLFQCAKSRLAVQMLTNLAAQGPALALYPASQRVTFLYYLGRFNLDHGDYYRAHTCLAEAYRQCRPRFLRHRRQIVTYWVPSNLLLARFPHANLLARPEAAGLADVYLPIRAAVRAGSLPAFQDALARARPYLWRRGIYLHLLALRCLVWRSLTRRTFLLARSIRGQPDGAGEGVAAVLHFGDLVVTATHVQRLLEGYTYQDKTINDASRPKTRARPPHINSIFMRAVTNSSNANYVLTPPPDGPRRLAPNEGVLAGNQTPTVGTVEGVVASLVYAGLLSGFVARGQAKFAIEGAKRTGGDSVRAGWPVPYETIMERLREVHDEAVARWEAGEAQENPGRWGDVPGWVRET